MKEILTRVSKLIDVKSIMTLALTVGFLILVATGKIAGNEFMSVYIMIVGFYFGTQSTKNKTE
jgi:NhaP-type Na+/H+ and K+/H+ antiporter